MEVRQSSQYEKKSNPGESQVDRRTPPLPSAPHHSTISGSAKNRIKVKRHSRKGIANAPVLQPLLGSEKVKPVHKSSKKHIVANESIQRNPGDFREFSAVEAKQRPGF